MTHIALLAHSLNSHVNDELRRASGPNTTVLVTNVHYADDTAMRALLEQKHAEYRPGTTILYTPHGLIDTLANLTGPQATTVIVDSLNFVVSNLLLLYNSDDAAIRDIVTARLLAELDTLATLKDTLAPNRLIFLTSAVDHDFFLRSRIGRNYRHVLHAVNARLTANIVDSAAILLNGARLPLTLPTANKAAAHVH